MWELNLSVDTAGTKKRIVKDIDSVSGHDNLDLGRLFETIQLVEKLEHCPLYFRITSGALHTRPTDGVDLIHEDDRRGVLPCHDEKFSHHARTFTDIFLDELTTRDTDELAVGVMGNSPCEKCLSCSRWSVEQDTLGLCNTQRVEDLWMLDWQLNDFFHFLDLLVQSSDHVVGRIWHLLDLHQTD